jgi:hypothetical protein
VDEVSRSKIGFLGWRAGSSRRLVLVDEPVEDSGSLDTVCIR